MSTIQNCKILSIPKIEDPRGNLSVIENDVIPFDIKRVYYLYDVPSAAERGGHSHIEQQEFLIALSGSFDVILNDGKQTPMKNHPVFIAQHATASCCRGCLYKWYHIKPHTQLNDSQQEMIVQVIMAWIKRELQRK